MEAPRIIHLHRENSCQESHDSHEESCNPDPGIPSHSFVGEGPLVKKKRKMKKKRDSSQSTIASSVSQKRRRLWNPTILRKSCDPLRQQKSVMDPKIHRKSWIRIPRKRNSSSVKEFQGSVRSRQRAMKNKEAKSSFDQ